MRVPGRACSWSRAARLGVSPDDRVPIAVRRSGHLGSDHQPGVDGDPNAELQVVTTADHVGDLLHGGQDVESGVDGPPGVVLVGTRIPEVHDDAITEKLGDMPVMLDDDLGARRLVGAQHVVDDLGVGDPGQRGGSDHVAEEDRQLTAFTRADGRVGVA